MLVCFRRRPKGPGGDILDRGGSGGMCPPSTSVEDFAAKSVRPCHMVSGVHYRYSEGWMDGWIDGWMDGCMDAWMHGCMGAWVHGCMGAWVHGCMDAWMHGRTEGGRDGWMCDLCVDTYVLSAVVCRDLDLHRLICPFRHRERKQFAQIIAAHKSKAGAGASGLTPHSGDL